MSTLVVESFFLKLFTRRTAQLFTGLVNVMMTKHIEMFDDLGVNKRGLGQSFLKMILTF